MNIIVGKIIPGTNFEPVTNHSQLDNFKAVFGKRPDAVSNAFENIDIFTLENQNSIIGKAARGCKLLMYIGGVHKPLKGWTSGSPMDDPNLTAKFLLQLYCDEGINGLVHVQGQVSILLYDSHQKQLLLISDSLGMRSWYYAEENNGLIFGSTLVAAESLRNKTSRKLDYTTENFLLAYGFLPRQKTVYDGLYEIPARSILEWTDGKLNIKEYKAVPPTIGRLPHTEYENRDLPRTINRLYDIFMNAVEDQLANDQRIAVLLGGFDSALVASALVRLGKTVETFSFQYEDKLYNQRFIPELSAYLGSRHHWVAIDATDIESGLDTFAIKFNHPTVWPNYVVQTEKISRIIRSMEIRHCFSGDGCDALFYGYPSTFRRAMLYKMFSIIKANPKVVSRIVNLIGSSFFDRQIGHPFRVALNIVRSLGRPALTRNFITFKIFDETSLKMLNGSDSVISEIENENILKELAKPYMHASPFRKAYIGKGFVSPNRAKLVGSSDSAGITINSPYLHPGLKAFVMNLPDHMLRPESGHSRTEMGKHILAKMADKKNLLPGEVIYQKKMAAIDAPVDDWFAGPLQKKCLEMMRWLPFASEKKYLENFTNLTNSERLYMKYFAKDKVLSYGCALLVTYAAFNAVSEKAKAY